jgi:hypothetical protein
MLLRDKFFSSHPARGKKDIAEDRRALWVPDGLFFDVKVLSPIRYAKMSGLKMSGKTGRFPDIMRTASPGRRRRPAARLATDKALPSHLKKKTSTGSPRKDDQRSWCFSRSASLLGHAFQGFLGGLG